MKTEITAILKREDYKAALAELADLWGAKKGTPQGDRLDVLATLIDAYESQRYPMDPPDPIDAIKFRMEQQGLTRKDLEGLIGSRTRVAEVLNRKRGLSIDMIRRLHESLGISADVTDSPIAEPRGVSGGAADETLCPTSGRHSRCFGGAGGFAAISEYFTGSHLRAALRLKAQKCAGWRNADW